MNLCFITKEFPPETGWGGVGTYFWELANGLAALGHSVDVIAFGAQDRTDEISANLKVHRHAGGEDLPLSGKVWKSFFSRVCPKTCLNLQWSWSAVSYYRKNLAPSGIDIIEVPDVYGSGYFLKNLRLPFVAKLHTPFRMARRLSGFNDNLDTVIGDMVEKKAVLSAAKVISCSASMKQRIADFWNLDVRNITVVHNPVDTELFCPLEKTNQNPHKIQIGYFGRLEGRKGVDVLCQAFGKLVERRDDVELSLFGDDCSRNEGGSWLEFLSEYSERHQFRDKVVFKGHVQRESLPAVYNAMDICVVPSKEFENFPYSCLEPMACGRAVVASRCGGLPEMLQNGVHGLLVPPGHSDALADALLQLVTNHQLRLTLGANARRHAEKFFARETIARQTLEVYRKAINHKSY